LSWVGASDVLTISDIPPALYALGVVTTSNRFHPSNHFLVFAISGVALG
jgi:hypothetical protein